MERQESLLRVFVRVLSFRVERSYDRLMPSTVDLSV